MWTLYTKVYLTVRIGQSRCVLSGFFKSVALSFFDWSNLVQCSLYLNMKAMLFTLCLSEVCVYDCNHLKCYDVWSMSMTVHFIESSWYILLAALVNDCVQQWYSSRGYSHSTRYEIWMQPIPKEEFQSTCPPSVNKRLIYSWWSVESRTFYYLDSISLLGSMNFLETKNK